MIDPKDDPRSTDELFQVALCETDEDPLCDAIYALHHRGTREVLDRAIQLCESSCAYERRVGAWILGQNSLAARRHPEESLAALLRMLEAESDPTVLASVLIALGHHNRPEAIEPAARFRAHPDPDVRYGVVQASSRHDDALALATLIELTRDPVDKVRDWATFGLGSMTEADTPALREALLARCDDPDFDTQGEALVGLSRRGDRRVLPFLREALGAECVERPAVEAAGLLGDPSLLPDLIALREWWDVDDTLLAGSIEACSSGRPAAP